MIIVCSADPDVMSHAVASDLVLRCLSKYFIQH